MRPELNVRAVNENIEPSTGELNYAGLEFKDRLLNRDIEREEGDASLGEMLARLKREEGGDGDETLALVLCHESLANSTLATSAIFLLARCCVQERPFVLARYSSIKSHRKLEALTQ